MTAKVKYSEKGAFFKGQNLHCHRAKFAFF